MMKEISTMTKAELNAELNNKYTDSKLKCIKRNTLIAEVENVRQAKTEQIQKTASTPTSAELTTISTETNKDLEQNITHYLNARICGQNAVAVFRTTSHVTTLAMMQATKEYQNGTINLEQYNNLQVTGQTEYQKALTEYNEKRSYNMDFSPLFKTLVTRLVKGGEQVSKDTLKKMSVRACLDAYRDECIKTSPHSVISRLSAEQWNGVVIKVQYYIHQYKNSVRDLNGSELRKGLSTDTAILNANGDNLNKLKYVKYRTITAQNVCSCFLQAFAESKVVVKYDGVKEWDDKTIQYFIEKTTKLSKDMSASEYKDALDILKGTKLEFNK